MRRDRVAARDRERHDSGSGVGREWSGRRSPHARSVALNTLNRRSFATLAAGTAAALAGCASLVRSYDRVVNMVRDAGCDPSGTTPCDEAIRRVAGDDTLLRFPAGTYLLSEQVVLDGVDRLGIVGDGDVRLRPPDGFSGKLLNVQGDRIELRNVDISTEAPDTSAGLRVVADRTLHVEGVEFRGRGTHPGDSIAPALSPAITSPDGTGTVKNVVAKQGSAWAHYKGGGGRIGIHVGGRHRGTLRIVDCHLEEFGNNGIYANDNAGNVQIEGGVYRNNNVAGIRIGGEGSYVDGALVEVDPATYTGPRTGEANDFNMRGIVVAQKPEKWGWQDPGVEIRNCELRIAANPSGSSAAVHAWHTARTVTISNTTIRMDENSPAIRRAPRQDTSTRPSSTGARWVRCEDVTITGSSRGRPAIQAQDADGSQVIGCRIRQTGNGSDGVLFENSTDCVVDGGRIETTRYPVYVRTRPTTAERPETCLVTFTHRPRLETTAQRLESLRDGDEPTTTLEQRRWLASPQCLDVRTLDALATAGDGNRNVAITGTGTRSLVVSTVDLPRD